MKLLPSARWSVLTLHPLAGLRPEHRRLAQNRVEIHLLLDAPRVPLVLPARVLDHRAGALRLVIELTNRAREISRVVRLEEREGRLIEVGADRGRLRDPTGLSIAMHSYILLVCVRSRNASRLTATTPMCAVWIASSISAGGRAREPDLLGEARQRPASAVAADTLRRPAPARECPESPA